MFSGKYCEIFKNNYFEEHPQTAAHRVRINQKLNLRKQVVCKTAFQGVSFLMKLHALRPPARKHENNACFA